MGHLSLILVGFGLWLEVLVNYQFSDSDLDLLLDLPFLLCTFLSLDCILSIFYSLTGNNFKKWMDKNIYKYVVCFPGGGGGERNKIDPLSTFLLNWTGKKGNFNLCRLSKTSIQRNSPFRFFSLVTRNPTLGNSHLNFWVISTSPNKKSAWRFKDSGFFMVRNIFFLLTELCYEPTVDHDWLECMRISSVFSTILLKYFINLLYHFNFNYMFCISTNILFIYISAFDPQ